MSNQKPCEVIDCPALAEVGRATCGPHKDARLAKALHIAKDSKGLGGKRCISCKRTFTETDWVWKTLKRRTTIKKAGDHFGHEHVQCEPPTLKLSRKAIRESAKPLLEVSDDIARDRGAA